MIDLTDVTKSMPVISSDGVTVGAVDDVGTDSIKLTRHDSADNRHHFVPVDWISRVDQHVHLNRSSAEVFALMGRGAQPTGPLPAEEPAGRKLLIPALIAAFLIAMLLIFLARGCSSHNDTASTASTPAVTNGNAVATGTAGGTESVTLPGGRTVNLTAGAMTYDVQRFLAGSEAAPRTFTFDNLNFDTNSSEIRAVDRPTLDALAEILAAYPNTKARVVGYADARGSAPSNADLGMARAQAVVAALTAKGIDAKRLEAASGGEGSPVGSNSTPDGRAENRRSDFVVTAR